MDELKQLVTVLSDDDLWDVIQYMRILVREQETKREEKQ